MVGKVAEQWIKELDSMKFYRHEVKNFMHFLRFKLRPCSISLKRIIKLGNISEGMTILELGSGGGSDSMPLAYIGCEVDALDCSDEVLKNLLSYKESLEKYSKRSLKIKTIVADILAANLPKNRYDVIFSCGVMEHFIDDQERKQTYKILSQCLKEDGFVITFVPNGKHPLRKRQRNEKLGGYNIPEIDYTKEVFKKDLDETGLMLDKVEGFDLFGYVFILPKVKKNSLIRFIIRPFYFLTRFFEPIIPLSVKERLGFWIFFVAKKKRIDY